MSWCLHTHSHTYYYCNSLRDHTALQQQQLQLKQQQLDVLASSPFGDSPLFRTALYVCIEIISLSFPISPLSHSPSFLLPFSRPSLTLPMSLPPQDAAKTQKSKTTPTTTVCKTSPGSMPQYRLSLRPSAKLKTTSLSSPARHREKNKLFEGLEGSPHSTYSPNSVGGGGEVFVPRKSIKTLHIRPKPSQVCSMGGGRRGGR